jgi:hypothetical protein
MGVLGFPAPLLRFCSASAIRLTNAPSGNQVALIAVVAVAVLVARFNHGIEFCRGRLQIFVEVAPFSARIGNEGRQLAKKF